MTFDFEPALEHFEQAVRDAQRARRKAIEAQVLAELSEAISLIVDDCHRRNLKWLSQEMESNESRLHS